jgi:DNA-directed RNA polymerase specialized sigma24 family protein
VTDDQLRGLGSEASIRDLEFQLDLAEYRDRFLAAEHVLLTETKLQTETYAAFLLIVRDGLTPAEAATQLGSSAGTATKNKNRVVKALLKEMDLPDRAESLAILAQVVGPPPVPSPSAVTPAPSV